MPISNPPPSTFLWHRPLRLAAGTHLVKATGGDLLPGPTADNPTGFSPWWILVNPGPNGDPGLDAFVRRARKSGRPIVDSFRDAYAVRREWRNSLSITQSGFLRMPSIRLAQAVDAFHGPAAPQPGKSPPLAFPPQNQVDYPGGAFQLFIPGLTSAHILVSAYYLI